LLASAESIAAAPLYIEDSSALTISELRSKCRQLKSKNNLGLIIIDYLQLMSTTGRVESRQQFVSDMSRSLKMLARELDVPIIALSQLNREVDKRPDHKPVLADLRGVGIYRSRMPMWLCSYTEMIITILIPTRRVSRR